MRSEDPTFTNIEYLILEFQSSPGCVQRLVKVPTLVFGNSGIRRIDRQTNNPFLGVRLFSPFAIIAIRGAGEVKLPKHNRELVLGGETALSDAMSRSDCPVGGN